MLREPMIAKPGIAGLLLLIVAAVMLGELTLLLSASASGSPDVLPLSTAYPGPTDLPTVTPQPEAYSPPAWQEGGKVQDSESDDTPLSARSAGSLLVVWVSFLFASGLLVTALFSSASRVQPESGARLTIPKVHEPPGSSHDLV